MDLNAYLDSGVPTETEFAIKFGDDVITLKLRLPDAQELQKAHKAATKTTRDRTGQTKSEVDPAKIRDYLVEHVITGWEGLTGALAARLARRTPPNGDQAHLAAAPIEYTPDNCRALFKRVMGLEAEIWLEVLRVDHERVEQEAAEKNG